VLGKWGTVKKNFTGTITEPVPPFIYNRLLDSIPVQIRTEHKLEPEPVLPKVGRSGQFVDENEFEQEIIKPLLKQWNFKAKPQFPCRVRVGGQVHAGRVDFFVSDDRGPLTLFENKRKIINNRDRQAAVEQARSYALHLGLPSFVVAAPEGFWIYAISRNEENLVKHYPATASIDYVDMKQQLLKLRS
jgi:hypothetical protein